MQSDSSYLVPDIVSYVEVPEALYSNAERRHENGLITPADTEPSSNKAETTYLNLPCLLRICCKSRPLNHINLDS